MAKAAVLCFYLFIYFVLQTPLVLFMVTMRSLAVSEVGVGLGSAFLVAIHARSTLRITLSEGLIARRFQTIHSGCNYVE